MRLDNSYSFLEQLKPLLWYRSIFASLSKQIRNAARQKKLGIGRLFSVRRMHDFKSSDTLFVLGGGPSINKLTNEQLNAL